MTQHSLQDAEPLTNRGHRPMASGGAALDNNDQQLLRIMSKRRSCARPESKRPCPVQTGAGAVHAWDIARGYFFNCLNPEQHRVTHVEPTLTLHLLKCCIYATRTDNCSFTDWMHYMARQPKMVPIRDLGGIRQCLNF